MLNQQDIDIMKQWIMDNIISEITTNTSTLIEEKVKEEIPDQKVSNSYNNYHRIEGLNRAQVTIRMNRGNIHGKQVIPIASQIRTSRTGRTFQVREHDRIYENKRLFRLPDGKITVLRYLPTSLAEKFITESFYEALTERSEFFKSTSQ